jgi:tryptophanase
MDLPYAEPYKIKMIEPIGVSTRDERIQWIKDAKYNLFNLHSNQVFIDLLTDSGTGAMSQNQWAEMMLGDESYAGASSYYKLKDAVTDITGFEYFLPTHQGRAAENVLFSAVISEGDIVPGNTHFDTTKGHIEFRKAKAIDCTIDEAKDTQIYHPFKGNVDLNKLENVIDEYGAERIPLIILTLTNNSVGGQPVSMKNIKDVSALSHKHGIRLLIDGARFAENAYFIKQREEGYADKTIREIVLECFSYVDAMTMSSKKDGYVNMGGFIAMNDKGLYEKASTFNIMYEGFITYGGMAGRDMNALAVGLYEGTSFETLDARIKQVAYLGEKLASYGIPVQNPFGGHAIFVNANTFLPNVPVEEYVAQTLAIELYKEAGVRSVEIGALLADRDPVSRENRYPAVEFVRLTIPRRTYTNNHMDVVAAGLKNVFDRREEIIAGYKIVKEAPIMRHFTVELEVATDTNHKKIGMVETASCC